MIDEERIAILAAFAFAAGAGVDSAWMLAAEAHVEEPVDLVLASQLVTEKAKRSAWGMD